MPGPPLAAAAPAARTPAPHSGEHVIKTIQPSGRINLPYPGHDGGRAINQCSHSQTITKWPSRCHAGAT